MLRRRADICCLFDLNNSKDMSLYLFILFSHFIALGSMNSIKPERTEERVEEGRNINLTCKYEGAINNIQWYRQYQRSRPEFLLYITEEGLIHPTDSEFSAHINKEDKRVDLTIISAAVTDSAVYYCALQPGSGVGKLTFGSGVKLTVASKEEYEPDYFRLESSGTFACLATGFTRQDGASSHSYYTDYFNKTEAIRIGGDKVYNQVALLESGNDGTECEKDGGSEDSSCEDSIKPDPTVNFVSVTVLCLRVIFIKTIVFNVLMTFRLWISQ